MSALSNLKASTAVVAPVATRDEDDALLARIETVRETMTEEDYATMRNHYSSTYGKETTLDDEAILLIVASSEENLDAKSWAGLMRDAEVAENTEAMSVTHEFSHDLLTRAHELGAKLAKDETVANSFKEILAAKELDKRGVAIIHQQLDAKWNGDDWSLVPVPGSKRGETGNAPFDIWIETDRKDNTKLRYSFYEEVSRQFAYYRDTVDEYNDVKDTLNKVPKLDTERARDYNKNRSKPWRLSHAATLNARRLAFIGTVKKACSMHRMLDAVNALPNVTGKVLTEMRDGSSQVMRVTSPIVLYRTDEPIYCKEFTINSFLKLKPEEAAAKAQGNAAEMYGCLVDTIKRDTKDKAGTTTDGAAAKFPVVESPSDFDSCLASLGNFVDVSENLMRVRKWFKEGKPDEQAEKVKAFADSFLPLDALWNGGLRAAYARIQEAEANAAEPAKKTA